jgi:hypothetical protein
LNTLKYFLGDNETKNSTFEYDIKN